MTENDIIGLLKKEMVVAMGCTEPAAAALAGAKAAELLGCPPDRLTVSASRDMIKNAMGVGIPNCKEKGILVAACLGVYSKAEHKDLSILSGVDQEQEKQAVQLAAASNLEMADDVTPVYVKAIAKKDGHTASCTVSMQHDHFSEMTKDGQVLYSEQVHETKTENDDDATRGLSLQRIVEFADSVDPQKVQFVYKCALINYDLAEYSVQHGYGLHIANTILSDIPVEPDSLSTALTKAAAYAAAGSDARMAGCTRAVVINSGSGNQGITCTVPVLILGRFLKTSPEQIAKALCISELIGLMITARKDRLSALCGAFTAAIGTGCAMVYLMGGNTEQMNLTVRTMVGNLAGMVCDGAKTSCALKIYSSVQAAGLAARMALNGIAPGRESGIIGKDAMESIDNLMKVSHNGMVDTDKVILSIMLDKQL